MKMKHSQTQEISHDPLVSANILNSHFASVGNRLASELPNSNEHFSDYLPRTTYSGSFVFESVLPSEIELEIIMAPSNKAHGLYSCPIRLLKCSRHIISKPFANTINQSVCMGIFPSQLKHAKIIPIYKDGNEDEPSHYRPISLLSLFNRLFEKVMYNRLKSFLNKYTVLYESQYGFRERRSTDHVILDIVNKIQSYMDKGMFSCGVFIDLQKAYLINRVQTTQIGSHVSEKQNTLCGVPQGSVLGSLLFLIYVNDMYKASNKLEFFLFADDTNLLYANKNLRSLETVMNDELLKIVDWLTANKLSLNVKKTNYIIFHPYQKRLNYDVNIKILDSRVNKYFNLERKEYVKYLGVMIDNHLSWKHHINYVALKISRNIGILSKLRHFVPPKTLFGIYNSLIFPYLSYGLVAWGQAAKTHLEKLLTLQKRAVRLINFAPFRSHAVPYFLHSNIMPITMLYFKLRSMLMFDVYNNTAPHNISHLFIPTQQIHSYSTRSSSSGNYYISHSRLNQKNDSFSIMGAKIWNSLPENLRNSSKSLFKEKVHTILLKIFEVQDRYADLNTIISDFKKY